MMTEDEFKKWIAKETLTAKEVRMFLWFGAWERSIPLMRDKFMECLIKSNPASPQWRWYNYTGGASLSAMDKLLYGE